MRISGRGAPAALTAAAAVACAACGGSSGGIVGSEAASVVPGSAVALVSIETDTESKQWRAADDLLGRIPAGRPLMAALAANFHEYDLDWKRDVRPAIGSEFHLVLLDLANHGNNAVALVKPPDDGRFRALIAKRNRSYPRDRLVTANAGDWTLVADSRAKLALFRRRAAAGPSLGDTRAYADATDELPKDAIASVYVDGPSLPKALGRATGLGRIPFLVQRGDLTFASMALEPTEEGLRLRAQFDTEHAHEPENERPLLLDRVPADAVAIVALRGGPGGFDIPYQIEG
jgi:hypothetical protein